MKLSFRLRKEETWVWMEESRITEFNVQNLLRAVSLYKGLMVLNSVIILRV